MAQPIPQIVHTSFILMMHRCERLTEAMLQAPSSPTSEVRLRSVFCHNLHILNRPRPVVSGIFERRNDAKNQTRTGSIVLRVKRLHSFWSKGCGGMCMSWKTRYIKWQISLWTSTALRRRKKPPREALRCLMESGTRRKPMRPGSVSAQGV